MSIKLTFGIPTYNGSKTIVDTLESICNQKTYGAISFDILISNNNSSDNVIEVCENYFFNRNFINYKIINNNHYDNSVDGNILNIYNNFCGDYLWFISDDDTLSNSNSLQIIAELIESKSPSVISVNYNECDVNLNILPKRLRTREIIDCVTQNQSEWLEKSRFYFGLISSLIIKKGLVNINEIFKFYGLLSLHIPIALISASNGDAVCVNKYLVNLRTGNTSWGKNGTFIINLLHISYILHKMINYNYDKKIIRNTIAINFKDNWKNIIKSKNEDFIFTNELLLEQYIVYKSFIRFWFLDLYLLFLPNSIIKLFLNIFKINKK